MIKAVLIRKYQADETLGLFLVMDGITKLFECNTLELPWLNNEHNISCIPEGDYHVVKYSDTRHKNVFWVQDVPDRDGILIHRGNFVNGVQIDSKGCLLGCMGFVDIDGNGTMDGWKTVEALDGLNRFLPDKFILTIC